MRVQIIRRHGDPSVFEPAELPDPVAGPGQVLVRTAAASVNPVDTKIRRNGPPIGPELPAVLGCDASGIVTAVGAGVTDFAPGDAVYGCIGGVRGLPGTYAELVAADADLLAHAPRTLPLREAAALPLVTITAWEGLERAFVQAGTRVLVIGGTGGVGHVAVQLAKARGAWVAATASTPEKAELLRSLGADAVIAYRDETLDAATLRLTAGRGFDVVMDTTGGRDLETALRQARLNGHVVTIVSTFPADLSQMHLKGLSLHVVFMLIPMLHDLDRAAHGAILEAAAALVDTGRLRVIVDPARYRLADVAAAHARLEAGGFSGKLVIDIAD
jgi:NADPH2:quinone reductase